MADDDDERVEVKVEVVREGRAAFLISDGTQTHWIARADCYYDGDTFYLAKRRARELGLVER